jgi:hypothetical protein
MMFLHDISIDGFDCLSVYLFIDELCMAWDVSYPPVISARDSVHCTCPQLRLQLRIDLIVGSDFALELILSYTKFKSK